MPVTQRLLFFEQIMDQLKGDIAVFDLQHRYVYVNPYAVKDPDMRSWIIGKTDREYCDFRGVDPGIAARRRYSYEEALRTRAQQDWEEHLLDKEGRSRAYIRRIFVVNDNNGNPEFLVGHGIEITDRWVAENELRNSRELLENVLQAAPGHVSVKDSKGRYVLVNNALAGLYNRSQEDLIGRSQHEVHFSASEAETFKKLEDRLLVDEKSQKTEEQFTGTDGVVRWFETMRIPFRNAQGESQLLVFSTDITKRHEKEILLTESERKLNEAQEMSKTGSYQMTMPQMELKWSRGMFLIWEIDPSVSPTLELFFRHLHPDDTALVLERQKDMKIGDDPWIIVYRIVTPGGKVKFIEANSKIETDEGSSGYRIVGTCQDITERRMFEDKLRTSEQRLLEAQEIARSGSWEIRIQPEISIEWSPGLYTICERDMREGTPDPEEFYNQIPEPDQSILRQTIDNMLANSVSDEVRYRFTTWKGNQRMFVSRGLPQLNPEGNMVAIYGTTTDITQEYETEERLRTSERELLMAQEIARVGSFVFDIDSRESEWSPGMYRIWEMYPDTKPPAWETLIHTVHPDDHLKILEMFGQQTLDAVEKSIDIRILIPGGDIKHLEVRYKRILQDGVILNKVFGTAMDVTEKKEAERELIRARKQAEDSVKAKEHFLASISHELRTPLNGILGMLRLMQKTNLNSIQREYLDVLSHTSGNLLTIINDILDFTRLESGGYSLEETVFDPALIADTAYQLQLVKAEEKGLLMRHLHEDNRPMPKVIGDPNRLSQILLNLLNNAVKYTNRGEVLMTHRVVSTENDRVVLSFSVKDTGIGIPLEMKERIFESFTQVHASEFGGGGVGLGLTITKGLVERLGGSIRLQSTPDVGSVFTVEIPFRTATPESDRPETNSLYSGLGGLRVLVVEDNKVNLYITESMLQAWGLTVDVALNGGEAVRMAEENNYDLILMDIQMPVMDGLEATRQIRNSRNRARASVPVIAVTANTSRLAHRSLIMEGMNDCLVKPFREDQLFRKIISNVNKDSLPARTLPKRKFPQRKAPAGKSKALYDLSLLMRDDPGNAAFLKRMLSIFIETIPASVDSMQEHFANEEWDLVSTLAHKIKPTLDGTGIISLRDTIRNIEGFREKKRTPSQLREDIATLRSTIDEVVRSFKGEMERIQT